jgi:hypothetical protein
LLLFTFSSLKNLIGILKIYLKYLTEHVSFLADNTAIPGKVDGKGLSGPAHPNT